MNISPNYFQELKAKKQIIDTISGVETYKQKGAEFARRLKQPDFSAYKSANSMFAHTDPLFGPIAAKALFDGWTETLQLIADGYKPLHVEHCKCGCASSRAAQVARNELAAEAVAALTTFTGQTLIS